MFYAGVGRPMFKAASARGSEVMMVAQSAMATNATADFGVMEDSMVYDEVAVEEEMAMPEAAPEAGAGYIRENFANTIAWEPFLLADDSGNIHLKFTNADKLST